MGMQLGGKGGHVPLAVTLGAKSAQDQMGRLQNSLGLQPESRDLNKTSIDMQQRGT